VLFIFISICIGGNFYIAKRLYQFFIQVFPHFNVKIYIGVYIFIASSLLAGLLPLPLAISKMFNFIGAYWLGFFMYFILLFFAVDLIVLLGRVTNVIHISMLNNIRLYSGLAVVILTVGILSYGIYNANQIKITNYEIEFKNVSLNNMKVVMISDLHLGDVHSERNLESMVKKINDLNPDIVCFVGDIFNDNFYMINNPEKAIALFKNINAVYGVYACLGNHDGGHTLNQMKNFLEESYIKLLNDDYIIIDERLALFGRLDASPIGGFGDLKRKDISDIILSVSENMPVIVIDHNPVHINEYGNEVDLILSGHTHSGQMFPVRFITKAMFVIDYGHHQKDTYNHVIVTSGVSTWRPPMRIGTNNEIVSILIR